MCMDKFENDGKNKRTNARVHDKFDCNLSAIALAEMLCAQKDKQELAQLVQFLQMVICAIKSYMTK